jgi:hypothetical protein
MTQHSTEVVSGISHRQTLHASVVRACVECQAPGLYQSSESFVEKYPELYRPAWAGQPVGDVCPHCGHKRPKTEDLGEIWSKEWRVGSFFQRLFAMARSLRKG